jgi:histidine kinase/histidine kinase/DNA gyrase B/HSP90-like ATPase
VSASDPTAPPPLGPSGWERFSRATASGFQRYAEWLVSITWKKFFLLSLLLLIGSAILAELPPFSFKFTISADDAGTKPTKKELKERAAKLKALKEKYSDVDIKIDETGVHVTRKRVTKTPESKSEPEAGADPALPAPPAPPAPPQGPSSKAAPIHLVALGPTAVSVKIPTEVADEVRAVVDEVRKEIRAAIEEEIASSIAGDRPRVRTVRIGSFLPQLAMLLIVASIVIKIVYAGRVKAEVKAAVAQEVADGESLKRQVVEARMAAMQAQIEPHFLFNTLASIDHLIEVDPPRASKMQKNLISLLRASMPALREGGSTLGRELAVVRPYLEILKVRMEDRLQTEVNISEGLHSAEFPPMMLQSLVENAIKHGLEPKPAGGSLQVSAEIVHGKLVVAVADTGVGFGGAATAGTGVGLENIRERLKLLFGTAAELRIAENQPTGTRVTIVVPYRTNNSTERA